MNPPPPIFNMADFVLGPASHRPGGRLALQVWHDAAGTPDCYDYDAVRRAVGRAGAAMLAQGLVPGDRVMLRLGNEAAFAFAFFGAIAAGLVAVPTSAQLTAEEAGFILADSGAKLLVLGDGMAPPQGASGLPWLTAAALAEADPLPGYAAMRADDPAFLVYTSGTTGRPKGVLHAHRSAWGRKPMVAGWSGLTGDDTMFHAGALNWTYTLGVGLTDPWMAGAAACVYDGPKDPAAWPALLRAANATIFAAVPTLLRQILKHAPDGLAALPRLRHVLSAGEALAPAVMTQWINATGKPVFEALGMSEISTYISTGPGMAVKPGAAGRAQAGRKVAILPLEGGTTPLPPGETGLIAVSRDDPGLMLGYWNRPEEEAQVLRGPWFTGGDLGHMDQEGYIYTHGRADDVMNAMGYRVSPAEVEAVLAAFPGVAEAGVAERPLPQGGAIIAAYIVPAPGQTLDAAAIKAHAAAHLAPYKCPREIFFRTLLPHTANGKLKRKDLA